MNPLNCATLEAAKKLRYAGIVLETEAYWVRWFGSNNWVLQTKISEFSDTIPAPSMAEVWRELPEEIEVEDVGSHDLIMSGCGGTTYVGYYLDRDREEMFAEKYNVNPTDALIDLLIWVTKEQTKC